MVVYWIHNPKTIDRYYPLLESFFFSLLMIASASFSITGHLSNDDEICSFFTHFYFKGRHYKVRINDVCIEFS